MEWIVLNVALCFTLVVHFLFSNASSTNFKFSPTASLHEFLYETRQASSKIECIVACASQLPPCPGISYNGVTGQCQLLHNTDKAGLSFYSNDTWKVSLVNMLKSLFVYFVLSQRKAVMCLETSHIILKM